MTLTKTLQPRDAEKKAKYIGRTVRSSIWLVASENLKLFTFKAFIMLGSKSKGWQGGHGERQQKAQQ